MALALYRTCDVMGIWTIWKLCRSITAVFPRKLLAEVFWQPKQPWRTRTHPEKRHVRNVKSGKQRMENWTKTKNKHSRRGLRNTTAIIDAIRVCSCTQIDCFVSDWISASWCPVVKKKHPPTTDESLLIKLCCLFRVSRLTAFQLDALCLFLAGNSPAVLLRSGL